MSRSLLPLTATLAIALLVPSVALATVRTDGVKVRWLGETPAVAAVGVETRGRFEVVAPRTGVLEDVRIEGAGWTGRLTSGAKQGVLTAGGRRAFEFAATPRLAGEPLEIVVTFDGRTVGRPLRLDAATLERARRAAPLVFRDGPPAIAEDAAPRLDGQSIRFRGRFTYLHADTSEIGADSIFVQVMDDDLVVDEVIWEGYTDTQGNFDVTVSWDDCDVLGCDAPDIYVRFAAENAVIDVHENSVLQITYAWSSENQTIPNYTGSDLQFGNLQPTPSEHGAVSVYNGIRRAWRHAWDRGGMSAPWVEVFWPNDDRTYYDLDDAIFIGFSETWNEGTLAHEFGHFLHHRFGNLVYDSGDLNYCGAGHCAWCPESVPNGFAEGFAGWFGYTVNAQYLSRYGITPLSFNDFRYQFEGLANCCQSGLPTCTPNQPFPGAATEGYTAALMQDIEDAPNDDHDGGGPDCDMDVMTLGDDEIYVIMRDDDPSTITEFITAFRNRYPENDQDFWSTVRNVWTGFGFPVNPPLVQSQPEDCRVASVGETVVLQVQGNGALLQYQWRRDGMNLTDGLGVSGAQTRTLTLSPVSLEMGGEYRCFVSTCDGTYTTFSMPSRISVFGAPLPRALVSWGRNESGQAGNGTATSRTPPTVVPDLPDMIAAEGGREFTIGLRANGSVYSWGLGYTGELGGGSNYQERTTPGPVLGLADVIQVAAGEYHALALKKDGTVWGWGYNGLGNLGDSTQANRPLPVRAKELEGCVKAIACGAHHSLALMADGTVQAWGNDQFGTLGRGTSGGWSFTPQSVQGLTDVAAISAGRGFNLAVKSDGTVWAWGWNHSGCLGTGLDAIALPLSTVPVQVQGLPTIKKIEAGHQTAFAISIAGAPYSWGSNEGGVCGNGDGSLTQRLVPAVIPGLALPQQIVAGVGGWAAAIHSFGIVSAWGYNYDWAAGYPTTFPEYLFTPVPVPGVHGVTMLGHGWGTLYATGQLTGVTDVTGGEPLPVSLALAAAPNPSLGRTRLSFDLPREALVTLAVYDIAGRRVRTVFEGTRAAGRYTEEWDGRGEAGTANLAGVYYVRLDAGGETINQRIVRIH